MKKVITVTISDPNPYTSNTEGKKAMVSYKVTGSKENVEAFREYQKRVIGRVSEDENGNPLFHVPASTASQYGVTNTIQHAVSPEGDREYWFVDNSEEKEFEKLVAGMDDISKQVFAAEKLEKARAFARVLVQNRAKNITKLQEKAAAEAKANLS